MTAAQQDTTKLVESSGDRKKDSTSARKVSSSFVPLEHDSEEPPTHKAARSTDAVDNNRPKSRKRPPPAKLTKLQTAPNKVFQQQRAQFHSSLAQQTEETAKPVFPLKRRVSRR